MEIRNKSLENIEALILIVIIFISVFQIVLSVQAEKKAGAALSKFIEKNRPAQLDIITIKDDRCEHCFDLNEEISRIETENAEIKSIKNYNARSNEGIKLISKYKISAVPAMIISGEINKYNGLHKKLKDIGEVEENVIVFKNPDLPYFDLKSQKAVGSVKVILVFADDCNDCYNYEKYVAELKILGIATSNRLSIDYNSDQGKTLLKDYQIDRVPTFVVTGDIDSYPALKKIGDYDGNSFVLRNALKPYLDLSGKSGGVLVR